jgi:tetratricopeptide (TPR) repeat protein
MKPYKMHLEIPSQDGAGGIPVPPPARAFRTAAEPQSIRSAPVPGAAMCGVGRAQDKSTQLRLRALLRPGRAHSDRMDRISFGFRISDFLRPSTFGLRIFLFTILTAAACAAPSPEPPPTTPREMYNAGTRRLAEGKLREAEALFESALATQTPKFQGPALYNLGQVRFKQGSEELKKAMTGPQPSERGRQAVKGGDQAIQHIDAALAGNDVQRMVSSYLEGKGARRELQAATKAVKSALEMYRATLTKWQRASDDFESAAELDPSDADARANAEFMDGCIAKLIDTITQMERLGKAAGDKKRELDDKMKQLGGRIPEPQMPPGAPGDDDEEEDQPFDQQAGHQEAPARQGIEIQLSPEQAGWLLDGFKLGGDRRLPMGGDTGQPKNRKGKTW